MKDIDFKQLKTMVKEAMFNKGGLNEPSGPEGVPHRMPAADPSQSLGDPDANEMYNIAFVAREATEALVEALSDPIYDGAYEHAFKATMALRDALNALIEVGAVVPPEKHVVAAPRRTQKYYGTAPYRGPFTGVLGGSDESGEGY